MGTYYVSYKERRQEGIHAKFAVDYFETLPQDYSQGEVVAKDGFFVSVHPEPHCQP